MMRVLLMIILFSVLLVNNTAAKIILKGINKQHPNIIYKISVADNPIIGYSEIKRFASNHKGEFYVEFESKDARPYYIFYEDSSIKDYYKTIRFKIWLEPSSNSTLLIKDNKLEVRKSNELENKYLLSLGFLLNSKMVDYDTTSFDFIKLSNQLDSIKYSRLELYYKDIYKKNFSNTYKNYVYTEIIAESQRDKFRYLIEYSFIKKVDYKSIILPQSFHEYIENVNLLNDSSFISLNHLVFLSDYFNYKAYVYLKQNEDYNLRYYRLLENELNNHPNTKLYLKIKLFNRGVGFINNLDTLNLFYSKLIGELNDSSTIAVINKKYQYSKSKLKKEIKVPDVYVIDTNGNKVLLNNYFNKVTYIDFWGTWCKPCMEAMPFQKVLENKYQNQPISFIYLNNNDPDSVWKNSINKIKVNGLHFKLDKESSKVLSSYFVFTLYPYYAILNADHVQISKYGIIRPKENAEEIIDELLGIK